MLQVGVKQPGRDQFISSDVTFADECNNIYLVQILEHPRIPGSFGFTCSFV